MQNKQSWASFSPVRTGIVLNFVGEFSSPLLRCPLLTLHIIQMRTPAASVPRWLEALGSVTELSPLELLKKKKNPPFTNHHPAVSGWVSLCGSFHNLYHLFLYVLCAQGCTRGKAHCHSVPGYAVFLRHKCHYCRHLPGFCDSWS